MLSAIGVSGVSDCLVRESGSEGGTPRDRKGHPYLVAEHRDTDMPFLVNPRVIDLRRELYLPVTTDKENQGDRCNPVSKMR